MWHPAEYPIAFGPNAIDRRAGYTYRGLGLHKLDNGSPKGRRPPRWRLTHLGSGHSVAIISGKVADAFPIAGEIAECGDWDFDGLDGWRNRDPDLPAKFRSIAERYPKSVRLTVGPGGDADAARLVVMARLGRLSHHKERPPCC